MTTWASTGLDNVSPGEIDVRIRPKYTPAPGTMLGVLYCHGAGGLGVQALLPAFAPTLTALAAAGHPVLSCDLGGQRTWGTDVVLDRITTAAAHLQSAMGAKAGRVLLVGASMGGLSALVWAQRHPELVAGIVGIVPVTDVTDVHTNNRQGLAAQIDLAYPGGWSQATHGPTRNPITMAAAGAYTGIPMLLLSAASDTTVMPATVAAMASTVATAQHVSMDGTHDTFTVPVDQVLQFAHAIAL